MEFTLVIWFVLAALALWIAHIAGYRKCVREYREALQNMGGIVKAPTSVDDALASQVSMMKESLQLSKESLEQQRRQANALISIARIQASALHFNSVSQVNLTVNEETGKFE